LHPTKGHKYLRKTDTWTKEHVEYLLSINNWSISKASKSIKADFSCFRKYVVAYGYDVEELKKRNMAGRVRKKINNHEITSIEVLEEEDDVYDLSVEDHHCFIANEILVHNCSNPNVQQIPARDKSIRRAFIFPQEKPEDDFFYLFHDYSQIEVRLTAHASLEPVLIEAFELKQDVHLKSSCLMFDVPYEDGVSIYADETHKRFKEIENYRKIGKIINFAIIYGVSAVGLTVQIPRPTKHKDSDDRTWLEACQSFIDNYFDKHRQIKRFVQRSNKFVQYNGWVENAFGRIRHLPHYNAVKRTKRAELKYMEGKAKRQGTNFLVQSLASDIFKMACVRVAELLEGTRSELVSYVHDENHIYMHRSDIHLVPSVKFLMENFKARVALTADTSISTNSWAEKVGVDGYDFKKVCELAKVEWTEELDQKAQDTLAFIKSKYKVIVIP
jgi:hypothetical protein